MKLSIFAPLAGLAITAAALPTAAQTDLAAPLLVASRTAESATAQVDLDDVLPLGRPETVYERYPNGEVRIERQVTLDKSRNYVNHGPWKMFDQAGALVAEGQYDMGRRTGVWTKLHARVNAETSAGFPFNRFQAPFLSTATFTDGVMDGHWLIVDKQERKVMQVTIERGDRHGLVITWLPNGEIAHQATYERGVPVGDVLVLKKGGEELERSATYLEGRQVVSKAATFRRTNQKRVEELYLAPKTVQTTPDSFWDLRFAKYEQVGEEMRHGPSKEWHANGQLKSEGQYNYGERTGRFVYWHPNGQKFAEGAYRDDKQHGRWVWWHNNGLRSAIGEYRLGAQTGAWLWWEADGRLIRQGIADAGADDATRAAAKPSSVR